MKRFLSLLLIAALILCLAGCAKAAGGTYRLEYITAEGMRIPPNSFGMNITLNLESDGLGTAAYTGTEVPITWTESGRKVTISSPNGDLEFTKDGKNLILHSEGTLLFFMPVEEEDED